MLFPLVSATYCDVESPCCENFLVSAYKVVNVSIFCSEHSNDVYQSTHFCDGVSPDVRYFNSKLVECGDEERCDADSASCVLAAPAFPDPWGYDKIESNETNLFAASVEPFRQSAVNGIALFLTWGIIPLLIGLWAGIRFRNGIAVAFSTLLSVGFLIGFDLLPQGFASKSIYLLVVAAITIALMNVFNNR